MVTTSSDWLLTAEAITALREELLPVVDLVTPNLPEAADLLGEDEAVSEEEMFGQLERLHRLCPGVLIKGGHLDGAESVDLLQVDGGSPGCAPPECRRETPTAPAAPSLRQSRHCVPDDRTGPARSLMPRTT